MFWTHLRGLHRRRSRGQPDSLTQKELRRERERKEGAESLAAFHPCPCPMRLPLWMIPTRSSQCLKAGWLAGGQADWQVRETHQGCEDTTSRACKAHWKVHPSGALELTRSSIYPPQPRPSVHTYDDLQDSIVTGRASVFLVNSSSPSCGKIPKLSLVRDRSRPFASKVCGF